MSLFLLLKYFHILLFVFWLGTDMGTYYSSKFVIDPKLSPPQRATALNILLGCDLGPRIAMPLILPTGIHLASLLGVVKIGSAGLGVLWLVSFIWLALVLSIHFGKDKVKEEKLKTIDFWLRPAIVVVLASVAIYSFFQPQYISASWVSWKLLVLCGLILCGLGIRLQLKKFTPAFVDLMMGNETEANNQEIKNRMDKCLPYVYGIWIGLLVNAALGVHLI